VDKNRVAKQQRPAERVFGAVRVGQFAYNEDPTIAVAIDCWFRARRHQTRPFFFDGSMIHPHLQMFLDEPHQKFFDHCPH
jgi:hypothetical protein